MTHKISSLRDWQDERFNAFVYGPPGSGKTRFAALAPVPLYVAVEPGLYTAKDMLRKGGFGIADFPIIETTDYNTVLDVLRDPLLWIQTHGGEEWSSYVPETVVVDTITTLEGYTMDQILADAGKETADIREFKRLNGIMVTMFRRAWDLHHQHTILLGQPQDGRDPMKLPDGSYTKRKPMGPSLTGQLVKQGPGLADFYLYFDQETIPGCSPVWKAWTRNTPSGFPARARGEGWPVEIENPSVAYFLERMRAGSGGTQ